MDETDCDVVVYVAVEVAPDWPIGPPTRLNL
jgi:hypothetical protein